MTLAVHDHATGETLHLCAPASEFGFASKRVAAWALSNERGTQLLRVVLGRGSLTVIGPEYLLSPRVFPRGDDARALIEGTELKRGERLLIFSPAQAEPLLAILWRLAAPAILCFSLAGLLMIWRHVPRFGTPVPVPAVARRSLAEQLRANARFAWRTGRLKFLRAAVLKSLERDARRYIPGYASLNVRQRAQLLGQRLGVDAAALNSAMTGDAVGAPGVQRAAIALLEHARRALLAHPSNTGQGI